MVFPVAGECAGAAACAQVGEGRADAVAGGGDDGSVEVDEFGIFADAVRVVAGGAGRVFIVDVLLVFAEGFVGEDAGAVVAVVAQGVGEGAFGGVEKGGLLDFKQKFVT